jgi:hypothetical protein
MRIQIKHRDYDNNKLAVLKGWLTRFPSNAKAATAVGMYAAAQDIMDLARSRAPLGPSPSKDHPDGQPGKLREAAYARYGQVMGGAGITVDMGFEGTFSSRNQPNRYIVMQHETTYQNYTTQGTGPFFFRSAVDDLKSETTRTIASYVNVWLRTGKMPAQPERKVPTRGGG